MQIAILGNAGSWYGAELERAGVARDLEYGRVGLRRGRVAQRVRGPETARERSHDDGSHHKAISHRADYRMHGARLSWPDA